MAESAIRKAEMNDFSEVCLESDLVDNELNPFDELGTCPGWTLTSPNTSNPFQGPGGRR